MILVLLLVAMTPGCQKERKPNSRAEEQTRPAAVTHWTEETELFMEYPQMIAGRSSRFTVHVTRLDNFSALAAGRVELRLERNGAVETFAADGASRPGVFVVDVTPKEMGTRQLSVHIKAPGLTDVHQLGPAEVYPGARMAQIDPPLATEGIITFLKEQQWILDFATEVVKERAIRESLEVPAEIIPKTGGQAEVTVPFSGRLVAAALPGPGTPVSRGEVLARLLAPMERPADYPLLQLERNQAKTALQLARRDRERADRLFKTGAVPEKRLEEARASEASAEARLEAAEQRIRQHEQTRNAQEGDDSAPLFLLRAPISGIVAETHGTQGANVESGETLFRIVDVQDTYVSGHVPEAELHRLRAVAGAEVETPGFTEQKRIGRLVSIGRIVDPTSRTVEITYQFNNSDRRFAVGQAVTLRLFISGSVSAPAVPESAIVDDAGRPVVFVQKSGEAFVRRPVRLGSKEAGYVQVQEGARIGERVVARGANFIRLASMSNQIPAQGHVH